MATARRSAGGAGSSPSRRADRRSAGAHPSSRPAAAAKRRSRESRPPTTAAGVGKKAPAGTASSKTSVKRRNAPQPKGRLTRRAAILAAVVVVLVLSLAYPTRQYLAQRAQIAKNQQDHVAQEKKIRALQDRKAQWRDKNYIRQKARERLQYVEPGELTYIVEDGNLPGAARNSDFNDKASKPEPWYEQVLRNMQQKDRATKDSALKHRATKDRARS